MQASNLGFTPTHRAGQSSHGVIRGFRSDAFKALAREAFHQGWDLFARPGGHIDAVSPSGAIVQMSLTAHTGGPVLDQKRREFERAGLDLRSKVARRRDDRIAARHQAPIDEAPAPRTEEPLMTDETTAPEASEAPFARVPGSEVRETIGDRQVLTYLTANGMVWALVSRPGGSPHGDGRKGFSRKDGDQAAIMAEVRAWLDNGAPSAGHRARRSDRTRYEGPLTNGHATQAQVDEVPVVPVYEVVAPAPTPAQGPSWRAVGIDPADYPIAVALAALDEAVGPAIAALEAAGKGEAADLIRAEVATTPAETELLTLFREVTGSARLTPR